MKKVKKVLKSDLGKSISSGYLLFFVNNIVALFLTPYMLKFISKEEYGLYVLCVDFLAWVSFLEFGTNKVIESKAGHLIAKDDYEGLNKTFNTSLFFQLLVSLLILPMFFALIYFGIDKPQVPHLSIIILLFSISASLSVYRSLFSAVIISSKKIHLDNRIQLVSNVLNYALVLLLVPYVGVLGLAIINLLALLIMLLRSNFRIKKLFPQIKISRSFFEWAELKRLFSLGMYFSLGSIATMLLTKIDSFVIGKEFGLETVASFYITIKLYSLFQKVIQMFLNNFRPHISQLYGRQDYQAIAQVYKVMTPKVLSIAAIGIGFIMLVNHFFITLWVGKDFYLSATFSVLYGLWLFMEFYTLTARIIVIPSLFKIKKIGIVKFFEALLRIGILLILLPYLKILSLPLSAALASFVLGVLFFYVLIKKYFSEHQVKYSEKYIIIVMSVLLISGSVLVYLKLEYILCFLMLLIGGVGILNSLIFGRKEKLKIIKLLLK